MQGENQLPEAMADMCRSIDRALYRNACPRCGRTDEYQIEIPEFAKGIIKNSQTDYFCDSCREEVERIERLKQEQARKNAVIEEAKIPPEFLRWNSEKGNNVLARQIRNNRNFNLFIGGKNSCGKTRSAAYNLMLEARDGLNCRLSGFLIWSPDMQGLAKRKAKTQCNTSGAG